MRPSVDHLAEISGLREGQLAQVSFPLLLLALSVHQRTAVLELKRRQVQKNLTMEHGVPVECRSNLAHETLGRFLVGAGALPEEVFNTTLSESLARSVPLGEVLVEKNLIGHYELFRFLQQNLARKLLDLFAWQDGEFRLRFDPPAVTSPLKVKVPQLLLTGLLRFAPQREVDFAVAPLLGRPLAIHPQPHVPLSELRLSESHTKAFQLLAVPRSLGDLAQAAGLPFPEVCRLVYALSLLGALAPVDELPALSASTSAPAPAPTLAPAVGITTSTLVIPAGIRAPGAQAPGEVARLRNQVMETYLKHREQDVFDLLAVEPDAAFPVVQDRFLEFAERYAPWRFADSQLESVREKARELFLTGAAGFGLLSDPEQRNILRERRRTLQQRKAGGPNPSSIAIKTDLLDPRVQFQKGKSYMEQGKYKAALQEIEFAVDCDPQNSIYRAELAWCRFMESPSTGGRKAVPELEEAVRIDPQCGIAYFYGGQILGDLERFDQAEDWLRRANKILAPDRRPLDALRDLAAKRKKKG
ncbi:MAG: tetratricopeptide repeat protein [Acidobacteriota bacterium]